MLSSRIGVGACRRAPRAARRASSTSTWTGTPSPTARSTAVVIEPATARWLSLIRIAVVETEAVVAAAAALDRVLLELPQPGRRLARVEDLGAGSLDRVDEAPRERGDAGQAAEDVQRRAARRSGSARAGPSSSATLRRRPRRRRRRAPRTARSRPARGRRSCARSRPQTTPRSLTRIARLAGRIRGNDALGGEVAVADVLPEPGLHLGDPGQCHRSSTGSLSGTEDDVRFEARILRRGSRRGSARRGSPHG